MSTKQCTVTAYVLALAIITIALLGCNKARDTEEVAEIHLVGVGALEHVLWIPVKYIGPGKLSLAQQARSGGKFHIVPLTVTYPTLRPWKSESTTRDSPETRLYILLSLMKTNGTLEYIRYLERVSASAAIALDPATSLSYFEELAPRKHPLIRIQNFFNEAEAVLLQCQGPVQSDDPKCTLMFGSGEHVAVRASGIAYKDRAQWRKVKDALSLFLKNFEQQRRN